MGNWKKNVPVKVRYGSSGVVFEGVFFREISYLGLIEHIYKKLNYAVKYKKKP
jgi:hypothetical protein